MSAVLRINDLQEYWVQFDLDMVMWYSFLSMTYVKKLHIWMHVYLSTDFIGVFCCMWKILLYYMMINRTSENLSW